MAPLGYVALYVLGLQVFRSRFLVAFLCVIIASGTQFWVSPRHSLGLISFAFVANSLMHFQETRTNKVPTYVWKLLLAGLSTSLAFWYSTEVGLYTLGAIGLFLVIYVSRGGFGTEGRGGRGYKPRQQVVRVREYLLPLASYGCGVLVGFLSVGIYFLSHGALDDVIWNSYIQCRYQLATWGLAFPSLSKTLALLSTDGWHAFIFSEGFRWYLPICIFLIVAAYLTYPGTIWHAFSQHDETASLTPRRYRIFPDSIGTFRWWSPDLRCNLFMAALPVSTGRWYFFDVSCFKRRETLAQCIEGSMGADPDSDILLVRWGSASTLGGFQWEMATLTSVIRSGKAP